jgi:hypothetical protein
MTLPRTPELEAALTRASERHGLQVHYRDCVRPLLGMPREQWPSCCGGGCEPCNATLVAVAHDVYALLGLNEAREKSET